MPPANRQRSSDNSDPLTIAEVRRIAKERLSRHVWDYYVSGSDDQLSVARNASIYDKSSSRLRRL